MITGSTKIVSIISIYLDVLTGFPSRLLAKGLKKTSIKPVGLFFEAYGKIVGVLRNVLVSIDSFVGSYLVIATTGYIIFKFIHFKVFNGIPDFGVPQIGLLSLPEFSLPEISLPDMPDIKIDIPDIKISSSSSVQNVINLPIDSRLRNELPS